MFKNSSTVLHSSSHYDAEAINTVAICTYGEEVASYLCREVDGYMCDEVVGYLCDEVDGYLRWKQMDIRICTEVGLPCAWR